MNLKRIFAQIILVLVCFFLFRVFLYLMYFNMMFYKLNILDVLSAFLWGIRFDLSISMAFLALPLLMLSISLTLWQKYWYTIWISVFYLISIVLFLILAIDLFYFPYVKRHLGHEILFLYNDINFIIDILKGPYLLALAVFVILCAGFIYLSQKIDKIFDNKKQINQRKIFKNIVNFLCISIFLFLTIRGSFSAISINIVDAFVDNNYEKAQLILNGAFTMAHTLRASNVKKTKFFEHNKALQILENAQIINSKNYPFYKKISDNINLNKVNVVIILVESWFNYFLYPFSQNSKFKDLTPYFSNVLYPQSVVFKNFFANGLRSIDAIQAILTSFPSIQGAPNISRGLELMNISNIANIANTLGYETLFLQSAQRRSFRLDSVASLLGFKHYFGKEDYPKILKYDEPDPTFGWDYEMLQFALEKISNMAPNNFFVFMFTGTAHTPFRKTPYPYQDKHSEYGVDGFLNTLHYVDFCLQEFFSKASQQQWFKNTVFIITGDHTVPKYALELNDLDAYRVPLIIYAPYLLKHAVYNKVASHLDILPTVVDLLNFNEPVATLGNSVFRQDTDNFVLLTSKENPTPILVSDKAFIQHSFNHLIKKHTFDSQSCDESCFQNMEDILLSLHQILYYVIYNNQWKP